MAANDLQLSESESPIRSARPSLCAASGSAAPDLGHDEREAWWCPTCKIGLVWHQVTYEETHDSRCGGCGDPVHPNDTEVSSSGAKTIYEANNGED